MSITETYKELKGILSGKNPERDETRRDLFLTFSTPHGKRVLLLILADLHFFDEAVGPEEIALSNYARKLLFKMGVLDEQNVGNIVSTVVKLAESKLDNEDGRNGE